MSDQGNQRIHEAVAAFEGPLCRYAARILGDLERARDAVQETFLRLLAEDLGRLEGRLGPWLFAVCRSRALDMQRKERRMRSLAEDRETPSPGPDPARAAVEGETRSRALAALEGLPAAQQEVIRLKFQEGMRYQEISRVTGLSESNVGFLIHRGIRALREQLAAG